MTAEEFKKSLDELYPQKGAHERAYDTLMRYEVRYELEGAFEQGRQQGLEEAAKISEKYMCDHSDQLCCNWGETIAGLIRAKLGEK